MWAKMSAANTTSRMLRGTFGSLAKRASRASKDSGGISSSLTSSLGGMASFAKAALTEIGQEEADKAMETTASDPLSAALLGFTAKKTPANPLLQAAAMAKAKNDEALGGDPSAAPADLSSSLKLSRFGRKSRGSRGSRKSIGSANDDDESVKSEDLEPPDSNESDEEVIDRWKKHEEKVKAEKKSKSKLHLPKVGFSLSSKKTAPPPPATTTLSFATVPKKQSLFTKLNPFKRKKTKEELEREAAAARALVYAQDAGTHNKQHDIYDTAKKERKQKPWEKARDAPVDICRLDISLMMHAPPAFVEIKSMKKVTSEPDKDGKTTTTKVEDIKLNSSMRKKFVTDLINELAHVAHISKKHITIDEITNRNIQEGYYFGGEYIIGKRKGEFVSSHEKLELEHEKLEEEKRKKKEQSSKRRKTVKENSPLSAPPSPPSGEEKKQDTVDSPSSTPTLPPISPHPKLGDIGDPGRPASRKRREGVPVKRKRDTIKGVKEANEKVRLAFFPSFTSLLCPLPANLPLLSELRLDGVRQRQVVRDHIGGQALR